MSTLKKSKTIDKDIAQLVKQQLFQPFIPRNKKNQEIIAKMLRIFRFLKTKKEMSKN